MRERDPRQEKAEGESSEMRERPDERDPQRERESHSRREAHARERKRENQRREQSHDPFCEASVISCCDLSSKMQAYFFLYP
ncbi:hypothetical protein CISIN_1g034852mg [Citrus sinensis]|uniref:Uncharacterized protein n=1 Tax=Citrus sinensis TaxID=2711 RepID=A0A067DT67_CITSI|nr:hypothetical protein CISIN_1g034852mg [Citrus sinensis]